MRRAGLISMLATALVAAAARPARATYSVVATDARTREVGGAGASCIGASSVRVIYGPVLGVGAVHAQAVLGGPGRVEAIARLAAGEDPTVILAAITAPAFDPLASRRQYGVVDLAGRAAGFTGADDGVFAAHRVGHDGTFTYAVQGNLLTGVGVLDGTEAGFRAGGCDLADRLMLALEEGAGDGGGDRRCTLRGVPADSAFLEVDRLGEPVGSYLRLEVTATGDASAVAALHARYQAWRGEHPCPAPQPDGDVDPDAVAAGCCQAGGGADGAALALLLALVGRLRRR